MLIPGNLPVERMPGNVPSNMQGHLHDLCERRQREREGGRGGGRLKRRRGQQIQATGKKPGFHRIRLTTTVTLLYWNTEEVETLVYSWQSSLSPPHGNSRLSQSQGSQKAVAFMVVFKLSLPGLLNVIVGRGSYGSVRNYSLSKMWNSESSL